MLSSSCDKGSEGCVHENACNYNETAAIDDNSCWYASEGCLCSDPIDSEADCLGICDNNEKNNAPDQDGDGICNDGVIGGCIDSTKCNYNQNSTHNDGSCAIDLSEHYGGFENGNDCANVCNGLAVNDGCQNPKCVGGSTSIGHSWRYKIVSILTFEHQNGDKIGADTNTVKLGASIFSIDGYNQFELCEEDIESLCENYIDNAGPPYFPEFDNNENNTRFYFPHNSINEWENWGQKLEDSWGDSEAINIISNRHFVQDIRGNNLKLLYPPNNGINWYAEIEPTLLDSIFIDSLKLEFISLEGVLSSKIEVFIDRDKLSDSGGIGYEIENDKLEIEINSNELIKIKFNISNICFEELY